MVRPLGVGSFSKAIIHIDGDSFFASCEQAVNPSLKGKIVVTGKERGIASTVSIEGKKLGLTRFMPIRDIMRMYPDAVYLPDDYELYSLMSKRMFEIVRRYTPVVEEYSIDECFADLTGLRRVHRTGYRNIAAEIKRTLQVELGFTFSVGLAPSKVLAKVGSKWSKPDGLVPIPAREIHTFLKDLHVGKIWGIGPQTTARLKGLGVTTAYQYAAKPRWWVEEQMDKPYYEIWEELNGRSVLEVSTAPHTDYQSISKVKTFTPPSSDSAFILSQLSKNIENACIKARRYGLVARRLYGLLTEQSFHHHGCEVTLTVPTATPSTVYAALRPHFEPLIRSRTQYRQTGVVLADLQGSAVVQGDLFGTVGQEEKVRSVFSALDEIDAKFGKHTVYLGTSLAAFHGRSLDGAPRYAKERAEKTRRATTLFRGETARQKVGVPYMGDVR